MPKYDPLIDEKQDAKGWAALRPVFREIHETLLSVDAAASSKEETIYIKYRLEDDDLSGVFAVVWIKTTKRLTVGLVLPEDVDHPRLGPVPHGMSYADLTKYFVVEAGDDVPEELDGWARMAFARAKELARLEVEDE